jgi:uncharacterized delta-60 repeat protein
VAAEREDEMTHEGKTRLRIGLALTLGPVAVLLLARAVTLRALTPGQLDTTFDGDGIVVTDIGVRDEARGLAIQSDGKIVVAGTNDIDMYGSPDIAVTRYMTTGALDPAFGGGDGIVTTTVGGNSAGAAAVVLQDDSRIVVAGCSGDYGATVPTLVRYTAAGVLDSSFGSGGIVTTSVGSGMQGYYDVAIYPNGNAVATGRTWFTDYDFQVARYLESNGSLDTTFNSTGVVTTDLGMWEFANALAVQGDGKIIVAGRSGLTGPGYHIALVRYTPSGALDPSFGTGGVVTTPIGSYAEAYDVALQPDGKIVVCGMGDGRGLAVLRYTTGGALDSSFGGDGVVTTTLCNEGYDVAIQDDGAIVVAGFAGGDDEEDFAIVRLRSDGSFDPLFDGDGVATLDLEGGTDLAYTVGLQADGRIVVAGEGESGEDSDFLLARYQGGPGYQVFLPLVLRSYQ